MEGTASSYIHRLLRFRAMSGVAALILLVGVGPASPAHATPQLFQSSALVLDAGLPYSGASFDGAATCVAAGDLDGDGRGDLVVTHYNDLFTEPRLSVLLSTNHPLLPPLFRPEVTYRTDLYPSWVRIADLNGDGKPDLVTANGSGSISVLLATGGGAFAPHVDYPAGAALARLVVADFNADGRPDIAATYLSAAKIAVLLGTGGGAFGAATTYAGGGWAIAAADVNGDGILDLISGGAALPSFDVLPGLGAGTFGLPTTWPTANSPTDLLVKDLNGDGKPDVVIAAAPDNLIQVHLNAGGGNFGLATAYSVLAIEPNPTSLAMGDMNADGIEDLVVGYYHQAAHSVGVFPRDPAGLVTRGRFYDGGSGVGPIDLADFDGDGRLDVGGGRRGDTTVGGYENAAYVLLGNGDLSLGHGVDVSIMGALASACSDDFNRDGKPDLAMTTDWGLEVRLGFGNATYAAPSMTIPTLAYAVSGDINRDGKADLVVNDGTGLINVRQGAGDGTFPITSGIVLGYYLWPRSLVDINRDGILDLVVRGGGSFIYTMIGTGGGFITPPTAVSIAGTPRGFVPGDWNRDGKPDLAVATSSGLSLLLGNGSGAFAGGGTLLFGTEFLAVGTGDVNRDGRPDLMARKGDLLDGAAVGNVEVFLGDGVGGFPTRLPAESMNRYGTFIDTWDVNRDGSPDLIADEWLKNSGLGGATSLGAWLGNGSGFMAQRSNYLLGHFGYAGRIQADLDGQPDVIGYTNDDNPSPSPLVHYATILRGNASPYPGTLAAKTDYATGLFPRAVATGDLNRDGKLDMVAVCNAGANLSVFLGNGLGGFGAATPFPVAGNPQDLVLGDFNRDGILDCATTGTPGATQVVSVLMGAGDGSFLPKTDYLPGPMGGSDHLVADDVNRDGAMDLITSGYGDKAFVLLGNGLGAFGAAIPYSYPSTLTHRARIADMNRDGLPDLVTTNGEGASISASLGDGTGHFGPPIVTAVGDEVYPLAIADFDRDGILDVAAGALTGGLDYIAILFGNGSGAFPLKYSYAVPLNVQDVATVDGNGDGILDLVASGYSTSQLSLLFGVGNGTFNVPVSYTSAPGPVGVTFGDYDRDGRVDFATANPPASNVSVFLNSDIMITAAPVAEIAPVKARLFQNTPNPFNPRTTIRFTLGKPGHAKVTVFDVAGRCVATLLDGTLLAGAQKVEWDGRDEGGRGVASGVYYYRLEAPGITQSKSMVFLK